MRNSSILLIGASGFIGGNLYKELHQHFKVIGTYNKTFRNDLMKFDLETDDISPLLQQFDLTCQNFAIITTAISKIDECFSNQVYSYKINVEKTKELIEKLNANNFKVIFLSTDFVFDGRDGNYDEVSKQSPITEYGRQKTIIEEKIFEYNSLNVVVRLSKTVSNDLKAGNIFFDWLKSIKENKDIVCIKDQEFVPTDVADVSKAIVKIIENDLSGIYNIVGDTSFSRLDLANLFCQKGNIKQIKILEKELQLFHFLDNRSLNTTLVNFKIKQDANMIFKSMDILLEEFWNNVV